MPVDVKICGLSTPEAVRAAIKGGAAMVGFVFFPPSPRCITPERQVELALDVPRGIPRVAVTVDAGDDLLAAITAIGAVDVVQLHGSEPPERVAAIRDKFAVKVMKAIAVSEAADLATAETYQSVSDYLMFDARPPAGAPLPGGNALAFDWQLIHGRTWDKPWLLAGGIDAANLAEAVATSGAGMVDVSSGVEDGPGIKNVNKIKELLIQAESI